MSIMPADVVPPLEARRDSATSRNAADFDRDAVSDGTLLTRYLTSRSDADFEAIVRRFGPLVLAVATRSVGDRHAAEDVFQTTFLTLVRSAASIRKPESLAAWLHGAAVRIGRKTLQRKQREIVKEVAEQASEGKSLLDAIARRHELEVVDEELRRLPAAYQAAVVLHVLEGKTCEQTAKALGRTVGSVRGAIQRGQRMLRRRLTLRGVRLGAVVFGLLVARSAAEAVDCEALISATVSGHSTAISAAGGNALGENTSSSDCFSLTSLETKTMLSTKSLTLVASSLLALGSLALWPAEAHETTESARSVPVVSTNASGQSTPKPLVTEVAADSSAVQLAMLNEKPSKPVLALKYGDSRPDGRKSIAGTGEVMLFDLPEASQKLRSVRVHGSRYGYAQAPDEDVILTITSADGMDILHTEMVPYSKFRRGEARWNTIAFEDPIEVPGTFAVIFEFDAGRTKGVYVSYDSSTDGSRSRVGMPGGELKAVSFEGDWLIQAVLTKPE